MRIKVPAMTELYSPMMGGLSGLGDCDDSGCDDTGDTGSGGGSTPLPIDLPITTLAPGGGISTPITIPNLTAPTPGYTGGGAQTVSTPSGDYQIVNGTVFDPNGNVSSLTSLQSALGVPSSSVGTSSAPNLAQILSAAATAATAASKIYNSTQTPSLIPGTNLVYNPANGQLSSALGATAAQVATSVSSIMPLLILGIGAVLVISMLGKK